MIQCPIAYWKKHQANAPALSSTTYLELDKLISRLSGAIEKIPGEVLAFIPQQSLLCVAFCFAAWRCNRAVFPLSKHLPSEGITQRISQTNATLVVPSELNLSTIKLNESIDLNKLSTLIETSSLSKIALHPFESHLASAKECIQALNLKQGDTYCLNLPLNHISGIALMVRTFVAGATLQFPKEMEQATHVSMVPTQLYRLLKQEIKLPKVKCLLIGGAPLGDSLRATALEIGLPIYTTYGMTEVASMAVVKRGNEPTKILSHIELMLAQDGEILLKGPSLMRGYVGRAPQESWFPTKDLGTIDKKGELSILGRKDRQFSSGGVKIQPEEVERALLKLPYIVQAKVTPMYNMEFGFVPKAEVYCSRECTAAEIRHELASVLPKYKLPAEISMETELSKFSKISQQ